MIEGRWIVVRDRQASLRREAEAERLARRVREPRNPIDRAANRLVADGAVGPSAAVLAAARNQLGLRLIDVGHTLLVQPRRQHQGDCQEA
jgi:hypothetical protein